MGGRCSSYIEYVQYRRRSTEVFFFTSLHRCRHRHTFVHSAIEHELWFYFSCDCWHDLVLACVFPAILPTRTSWGGGEHPNPADRQTGRRKGWLACARLIRSLRWFVFCFYSTPHVCHVPVKASWCPKKRDEEDGRSRKRNSEADRIGWKGNAAVVWEGVRGEERGDSHYLEANAGCDCFFFSFLVRWASSSSAAAVEITSAGLVVSPSARQPRRQRQEHL